MLTGCLRDVQTLLLFIDYAPWERCTLHNLRLVVSQIFAKNEENSSLLYSGLMFNP